jgi:lipopolysaccharide export system permease protein
MYMKKLQVYTLKEFISPFLLSSGIFTFVMLLDKLLDLLDMIVSKGVPVRTVVEVFLLLLPSMVAVVIPMGVLAGVLMAVGRMESDLEVTAMKSSGISIWMLIKPLMLAAVLLTGTMVLFNNYVLPDANHMAKNLLLDIGTMRPAAKIIPGMFVEDIDNYRIIVEEKDDITGELENVVIHERVPGLPGRTITALKGRMEPVSANRFRLILTDGQMHELTDSGEYRKLDFTVYTIEITRSEELIRQDRENRGDRELSASQMRNLVDSLQMQAISLEDSLIARGSEPLLALMNDTTIFTGRTSFPPPDSVDARTWYNLSRNYILQLSGELRILADRKASLQRSISRYEVEIHKKYSIPFACIVFVLLGIPLGLSTRKGSAGIALGISLLVILAYYLFLIAGEQLADRRMMPAFLSMWLPNIILGAFGVILTARSLHEGNPLPLGRLTSRIRSFFQRLTGARRAGSSPRESGTS